MHDLLIFTAIIITVIAAVLVFGIGPRNLPSWAKSKAGQGALASMALGVGVVLVVGAAVVAVVTLVTALLAPAAHAQPLPQVPNAYTVKASWLDTRYGHLLNHAYVFAGGGLHPQSLAPVCGWQHARPAHKQHGHGFECVAIPKPPCLAGCAVDAPQLRDWGGAQQL